MPTFKAVNIVGQVVVVVVVLLRRELMHVGRLNLNSGKDELFQVIKHWYHESSRWIKFA